MTNDNWLGYFDVKARAKLTAAVYTRASATLDRIGQDLEAHDTYNVSRNCIVRAPTRELMIYCTSLVPRRKGGGRAGGREREREREEVKCYIMLPDSYTAGRDCREYRIPARFARVPRQKRIGEYTGRAMLLRLNAQNCFLPPSRPPSLPLSRFE